MNTCLKRSALLLALFVLAACTSTTTTQGGIGLGGDPNREPKPAEAARHNAQLGIEYLKRGDLNLAKERIDRALKQDDSNVSAHFAAALLYERLKEVARAEKHYTTALRLAPKDPDITNNYGSFLCRNKRPAEGEKLFLRAAENPIYRTPELAYHNAGLCLLDNGHEAEAEKYFIQALKLQPTFGAPAQELAEMHLKHLRYSEARVYLLRYLQGNKPTAEILWVGVRVERGLGNRKAAEEYARKLKKDYPATEQTRALIDLEGKAG